MKSISYLIVIKTQFSCCKLRIIRKIKLSVSLINGDSLSLSHFLVVVNEDDSKDT